MASVVFLVEGYLFRVPRYYFARCSEIFASMFSLPPGEAGEEGIEGLSDELPLRLEGILKGDFKSFLKVIYPLGTTIPGAELSLHKSDWIAALKLSTLWNFREIRQLSITRLGHLPAPLTPVETVSLAKEYKVSAWLLRGYHELVRRTASITLDESKTLGIETTIALYQIREQVAAIVGTNPGVTHISLSGAQYTTKTREEHDFTELVRKAFKTELVEMDAAGRMYSTNPSPPRTV